MVRTRYPALTIWRMNLPDGMPGPVDLQAGGEDVLLVRPDAEVEVRAMERGELEFLATLLAGESLGAASQSALEKHADFDLAERLAAGLGGGLFTDAWLPEGRQLPGGSSPSGETRA
jgi:hypothetical protein